MNFLTADYADNTDLTTNEYQPRKLLGLIRRTKFVFIRLPRRSPAKVGVH
jgi:hypothetical protein